MISKITKIKDGIITIPPELRKSWNGAEIFVRSSEDTIVIKRLQKAIFWDTWEKLGKIGKKVAKKDVNEALRWARAARE